MLLLMTALAMAQDPAPETEEETPSTEELPAEEAPAAELPAEESASDTEGTSSEAEASGWSAEPASEEAPAAQDTASEASEEPQLGDTIIDAPEMPMPAPDTVTVPLALQGTYEEGYEAGAVAADELADWIQPAVAGAGVGAGIAGAGVVCGGLVCGGPAILGGAGYQAYKTRKDVPAPPPGAWQERSAEFQTGFIQGFQARASRKRTRWALAGGATGAVVGTGVGLVVVSALYNRQGRDFI